MYRYDPYDQKIVDERVAHFRDQTRRDLAGERGAIQRAEASQRQAGVGDLQLR